MNQGQNSWRASWTAATLRYGAMLAAAWLGGATLPAQAQSARQPQDGPNVTMDRDLAAGSLVDALLDPIAEDGKVANATTKALGGKPSKASIRPQWTARLARNPNPGDGNPTYVLIDRYGGVLRYVEQSRSVDLENYVGQTVSVRRDTGHTLLASQLDLPRSSRRTQANAANQNGDVKLAAFEEMPSPEPTLADGPPSPTAEPLPSGEIVEGEIIEGQGPLLDENGQPLVVPEGVDPLYLDGSLHEEGLHFDGCDMCGSTLCKMQGGCGYGSRPVLSVRGEYLLWWADGMPIPPLVVRGEVDDNGTPADLTDDFFNNAFVVYGNEDILDEARSGGRVTVTYWLDDFGRQAIEGDYFGFGQVESRFADGGDGTFPIVGRPFIDARNGFNAVEDVSFPGIMGTVAVDADSTLQSAGVRLRRALCCVAGSGTDCGDGVMCGSEVCGPMGCGSAVGGAPCLAIFNKGTRHVDVTYGARWAQLEEGLNIREDLEVIAPSPAPDIGTTFLVNDNFATSNEFIGGELGFMYDWSYKRWSFEFLSRLAIGRTRQRVAINGFTINTPPGGPAETGVGGLLAQSSNIGDYERNELSVLPQLGFTAGYNLTDRLKLVGGYTFIYWSRVV
ncbi:MAG TPA: BBP7 family outer membrane beta-barrel protein, partial [Lacipirellula sp.]